MSCDHYRRLVNEREQLLRQICPVEPTPAALHCPAAADRLSDFLTSGSYVPVQADGMSEFRIPSSVSYDPRRFAAIGRGIADCSHVVVRAVRSDAQMERDGNSRHHYCVLFRYEGVLYVGDAFSREVTPELNRYLERLAASRFEVVSPDFDVTVADPLNDPLI